MAAVIARAVTVDAARAAPAADADAAPAVVVEDKKDRKR
jgi:hypothetical protein